jgi:carboxyl-terminal processing protease
VGTKTYGKGTVQTVVPFKNKSSLKFTIAEWLTPDEHPINKIGIIPDVEVEQSDAGDAQLDKALELIRLRSR